MKIEIKELPSQRVIYLRHVGPYAEVGSAWGRLCAWAGQHGFFGPNARFLGASYDDPENTPAAELRYDACITIDRRAETDGEIGVMEVGGGEYAVAVHEGPYEKFMETYSAIYGGFLSEQGCRPGEGPCLEFYLNSPESTPPAELRTEVCVPIERE